MPKLLRTPTPQELYRARKQKEEQERLAYLPPGLYNHGNTCFMNSVLQGLIATRLLSDLAQFHPVPKRIHTQRHPNHLQVPSRKSPLLTNGHGQGREFDQPWTNGMPIGDVLLDLLLTAWTSQVQRRRETLSPKSLLAVLGRKYDQYLDFAQQDAHEFLRILLDATRMEELDIIKQRQPPPKKVGRRRRTTITPSSRRAEADLSEIPEEEKLTSLADMVFGGKLTSILVCQKCKHISQTSEDFNDISLSLKAEDYRLRTRDRFMNFAKRLTALSLGTDIPRSSSVPPRPREQEIPRIAEENERRSHSRSMSLDLVPDGETSSSASIQDNAVIADDAVPEATSNDLSSNSSGEVPPLALKGEKKNWARRISWTVGLGKISKEAKEFRKTSHESTRPPSQSGVPKVQTAEDAGPTLPDISAQTVLQSNVSETTPYPPPAITLSGPPPPSREPSFVSRASSPFLVARPSSPQPERSKSPKPPKPSRKETEYLRAILADTTPPSHIHLPLFKPNSQPNDDLWLSMGHFSGIEECLRMFTSVEVLDGENRVGCRRCWKIVNGVGVAPSAQEEADEDEDSDSGEDNPDPPPEGISIALSDKPVLVLSPPSSRIPTSLSSPTLTFYSHPNNDSRSVASLPETSPTEVDFNTSQQSVTLIPYENPILHTTPGLPEFLLEESDSTDSMPVQIAHSESLPSTLGSFQTPADRAARRVQVIPPSSSFPTDSLTIPNARNHHHHHHHTFEETDESSAESEASTVSSIFQEHTQTTPKPTANSLRKSSRSKPKPVIMRPAYKRYLIGTPPPVLVIHLKRFRHISKAPLMSFSHGFKKLDDYVTFPEFLDLTPYLAPKQEDFGLGGGSSSSAEKRAKKREKGKCMYRLYAVVVHIGNMLGGHYIAYTALPDSQSMESHSSTASDEKRDGPKRPRQWAYISDTVVRLTTLEEVLKAKAYICMYERI